MHYDRLWEIKVWQREYTTTVIKPLIKQLLYA